MLFIALLVLIFAMQTISSYIGSQRAFMPISDMVEIAISDADPITDPIVGTSLNLVSFYELEYAD